MKRWNFGGLRASHGVSVSHRSHGSTGQRQDAGRVFKGKKMAGRMGGVRAVSQNLKILSYDVETRILVVHGCIPGSVNDFVMVASSAKNQTSLHRDLSTMTTIYLTNNGDQRNEN